MRVPVELLRRLDVARGHEPRASFVKRALLEKLDGGPTFVVDASVVAAARPEPYGLRFSPEEERAHVEAQRREVARQLVPDRPGRMSSDEAARRELEAARAARQAAMNKAKGL